MWLAGALLALGVVVTRAAADAGPGKLQLLRDLCYEHERPLLFGGATGLVCGVAKLYCTNMFYLLVHQPLAQCEALTHTLTHSPVTHTMTRHHYPTHTYLAKALCLRVVPECTSTSRSSAVPEFDPICSRPLQPGNWFGARHTPA